MSKNLSSSTNLAEGVLQQGASTNRPAAVIDEGQSLVYETPRLIHYGDVRDVTLGPTVGIGESGNELGRRNPP